MDEIVPNITYNISLTTHKINIVKNNFLEQKSIDNYNFCNDLMVNFKNFYKEILERIYHLEADKECGATKILELLNKIKLNFKLFTGNENKDVLKNIEYSINQINELTESLIAKQSANPLDKEMSLVIQNQIMRFKYNNNY